LLFHVILLLYIACVWAFTFIFIKVEEVAHVGPLTIIAGRAVIAFICMLVPAIILKKDLLGNFKHIGKFLVLSLLSIVSLWVALSEGQEYINAGVASVMVTTVPLLTFIILVFVLREEKFSFIGLGGLLLGVMGIVLVVELKTILAGGTTVGGFLLIGSGFVMFAVGGILVSRWGKGIDPVVTTAYLLGIGAIILIVLASIFESPLRFPLTKKNVLSELGLGVLSTASGYFGYYYLVNKTGVYFSTFIFYFIPVFGLIAGYFVLGEMVAMTQILGVLLIIAGVYVINWEKRRGK